MFLKNLPKFSTAPASNLASSISSSPLVFGPTSLALEITLDNVPSGVMKSIDNDLAKFVKHYSEDSCSLGNKLWDENFTNHVQTELWCFHLKKNTLFRTTNEIEG